jgi:ubiquinone/menaquinone biosynthesis C-methylase UbiE
MQGTSEQISLQESRRAYRNQFGNTFSNQCARFMLESVVMNQDEYFLDVATGPGTAIFESFCKYDSPPAFAGIDASSEMLHGARSIQEAMWTQTGFNIEFTYGDVHHLSFVNDVFDGVFSNLGIHLFSQRVQAISEMRRVLKPGGSLTLTIPYLIPESYQLNPPVDFGEDGEDFIQNLVELSGKYNTILGEILNELEKSGFADIQTADTVVPYDCYGAQEAIGLMKTVLHFSGRILPTDRVRAFTVLDQMLYAPAVWGDTTLHAVNLGVTRICGMKQEK